MITKKDGVFFYYIADYFRSEHKLQIELIFLLPMFQMFPNNYANISSLGNLRFSDKHRKISQVNGGGGGERPVDSLSNKKNISQIQKLE